MNAQRPVKEVLERVKAGGAGLTPNDWRLLAFYSWETDQQQIAWKGGVPALLRELAQACPAEQTEVATRLQLQALAAVEAKARIRPDPAARARVVALLKDPAASRVHMDVLASAAADIIRALSAKGSPQRTELVAAFDTALQRFAVDATLSRADRLFALAARVDLARIDASPEATVKLPPALIADARAAAARADREITDGYERQGVIPSAAHLLAEVGLIDESDTLLKTNLAKSHSPYYLMSGLAENARKRGAKAAALHWYEEAYANSVGPATRLQWGADYVQALVELSPQDAPRIEQTVTQLFTEAAAQPDAFYDRSGRSLRRVGTELLAWNKSGAHGATLKRLRAQLDGACAALAADDPKRAHCAALLTPGATQPAA
jgi:hypothetical protein